MVIEEVKALAVKAVEIKEYLKTEEGSKTSLVLPLIGILGYDVFNPKHLMAELTADVGVKRGEKVDYALMSSGEPKLIIECKKIEDKLEESSVSQLFRYFTALRVKFGVLTNGIIYKFYSDLESPNIMDATPFFEFNLNSYTHEDLEFLQKFKKGSLVGQMKSLVKECKKRKLVSMIRQSIRETLECTPSFLERIKKDIDATSLRSVSKKELASVTNKIVLEESLRVVETSLDPEHLLPKIRQVLKSLLGASTEAKIRYRSTPSSVYGNSAANTCLFRIFSNGLDLKISFSSKQTSKHLRVVEDLALYSEELKVIIDGNLH